MVFEKCISVQASTPGGALHFPYGYQVSPRDMLGMLGELDLEHVAEYGEGAVIYATAPNEDCLTEEDDPYVIWEFYLPEDLTTEKWLNHIGWFRPLVRG
jgi:hypothetical protein